MLHLGTSGFPGEEPGLGLLLALRVTTENTTFIHDLDQKCCVLSEPPDVLSAYLHYGCTVLVGEVMGDPSSIFLGKVQPLQDGMCHPNSQHCSCSKLP